MLIFSLYLAQKSRMREHGFLGNLNLSKCNILHLILDKLFWSFKIPIFLPIC
jgi:hypothetical protein